MRAFPGESDIEFMMDLGQSPRAGSLRYVFCCCFVILKLPCYLFVVGKN